MKVNKREKRCALECEQKDLSGIIFTHDMACMSWSSPARHELCGTWFHQSLKEVVGALAKHFHLEPHQDLDCAVTGKVCDSRTKIAGRAHDATIEDLKVQQKLFFRQLPVYVEDVRSDSVQAQVFRDADDCSVRAQHIHRLVTVYTLIHMNVAFLSKVAYKVKTRHDESGKDWGT